MKVNSKNPVLEILRVLSWPAHKIAEGVHHFFPNTPLKRHHIHLGLILILLGAIIEGLFETGMRHFIAHAFGSAIHDLGIAPIAKVIFEPIVAE